MKILYIGHYKEGSGWSKAAIDSILALDSIGIDVVCKNIKLNKSNPIVPDRILELENKSLSGIDYCIQHVLPHHLVGSNKFKKNVAYFEAESSIKYSSWSVHLKQMDDIWVPNKSLAESLARDNIKDIEHCKVVHHTCDISNYQTIYEKIDFGKFNNSFKFYSIMDLNDRKNLSSIIKCFMSEFFPDENVSLVLKVKKYGVDSQALLSELHKFILHLKQILRINTPNKEVIITSDMSDEQIYKLHSSCDCFINPSHGEAWSIPSFEAMCFGKTPICSNEGGPVEFIDASNKNTGHLINGVYNVCEHNDPAFRDLFTGRESWFVPSEVEIKNAMRYYYEKRGTISQSDGIKQGMKFSYENIANRMRGLLNA
jgi:glycosyltransferase involved in cell wall biosynthesis